MSSASHRVCTPEELALLNILADNDTPDGLPDATLQKLIGRSPMMEAIDQLAEFGLVSEAIDSRGKKRPRSWRLTQSGEEQRVVQARTVAENLKARIDAAKVPDEASRLRELVPFVGSVSRAPVAETATDTPAKAKPRPKRNRSRSAPKRRDQAQAEEGGA
jgi:hypothetical protein